MAQAEVIETPENSCVVVRYPKDSLIERQREPAHGWRVACLLASPKALARLLDIPASGFPKCASWMAREGQLELCSSILPLQSAMTMAVNDILSCSFRGGNRRAYMRAKSIELLSTVLLARRKVASRV